MMSVWTCSTGIAMPLATQCRPIMPSQRAHGIEGRSRHEVKDRRNPWPLLVPSDTNYPDRRFSRRVLTGRLNHRAGRVETANAPALECMSEPAQGFEGDRP